jgi:hypothetical protein
LLGDTIDNERVGESIGSLDTIRDIGLRRAIQCRNGRWETISGQSIIKPLGFKHVKALLLIPLQDIKWDVVSLGPLLDLS